MSCRRISHWVLRNGADEIPPEWRDHVESCPDCLASVAKIRMLDGLLGEVCEPNPGETYESNFVPRLARRLDATASTLESPVPARRTLAWIWAPALAAAALAFFIGRDIYLDRQAPALTDRDVPVIANRAEQDASSSKLATASPADERAGLQRAPVQQPAKPAPANAAAHRNNGGESTPSVHESATPSTASDAVHPVEPASSGAVTAGKADQNGPTLSIPSGTTETPAANAADTKVWPDRRVTIMGAIASDTEKNARKDERGLPGQGPHSLSERGYVDGAPGAETVHTYHPLERLEAPQWRAAPGFPDSQSPAEAMRRLDQLAELRQQIATLEAINPTERTAAQNRELCTLWYRVGTLATARPLLDSALQQLGACLKATDQSESQEWQTRTTQLTERLSTLPK